MTAGTRFPAVDGRSLAGTELVVPSGLAGDVNVLILAFRQHHQAAVDGWMQRLATAGVPESPPHDEAGRAVPEQVPLAMYEIPMIGGRYSPVRRFIDGGMATSIRKPPILARTVTVYGQIGPVEEALRLPNRDQVYAVVVQRDGQVLRQAPGPVREDTFPEVLAATGLG